MMEAEGTSEILLLLYLIVYHHIPQDDHF